MILLLLACAEEPRGAPLFVTEELDPALAGEVYATWLEARRGEGLLLYSLEEGSLPPGLTLNPVGAISGVPDLAGVWDFTLAVTDSLGRSDERDLSLTVSWSADALPCGEELSGEFTEAAGVGYGEVDLDLTEGYRWIQIPLPSEEVTRIELQLSSSSPYGAYALLARPGVESGDVDFEENHRTWWLWDGEVLRIDLASYPDLASYRAADQPLDLLLAAAEPGSWSLTSACSDGPVFETLRTTPTLLGQALAINYNLVGDPLGARIWTEASLPEWVLWDQETGRVAGSPTETGYWEFPLLAEDAEGRRREETTGFGVFDVQDLACDEALVIDFDEGYADGEVTYASDTRGFRVVRTLLVNEAASALDLERLSYGELELVYPGGSDLYSGIYYAYGWGEPVRFELTPWSHPYRDQGEAYFVVISSYGGEQGTLTRTCDEGPLPDWFGLPVLWDGAWTLEGMGGTPPLTFSAEGLPDGVTLEEDGSFTVVAAPGGTWPVDVRIEDAEGRVSESTWTLYSEDEACLGFETVACGDQVELDFPVGKYDSWGDPDAMRPLCLLEHSLLEHDAEVVGFELESDEGLFTLELHAPGSTPGPTDSGDVYLAFAEGDTWASAIDAGTFPSIADYEALPLFLVVSAWEAGTGRVRVSCD